MYEKKIALIPSYEPGESLILLVDELKEQSVEIIIVNDGSSAEYNKVFNSVKKHATVLAYPENQGKGHALKTGFKYIKENFEQTFFIVTLDSDGQHTINDMLRVLKKAEQFPDELILGSRNFGRNTPFRSLFGNSVTRWIYRIFTGIPVKDTQTGLRAFHSGLLETFLNIQGERFEYEMNVLLECRNNKIQIREVPIETIYFGKNEHSHFRSVADAYLIYRPIIFFAFSSFFAFMVDFSMFNLFLSVFGSIIGRASLSISNLLARIISGSMNYYINKKVIFKYPGSTRTTAVQYMLLAMAIIAGNTLLLNFMVNIMCIPPAGAKIFTEITFFGLSFFVQHFVIFRKKHNIIE